MNRVTLTALFLAATSGLAGAQPLPAPPIAKYTAPAASVCNTQTLNIYFQPGDTNLTAASQNMLAQARDTLEGCILGPIAMQASAADAPSRVEANLLAEARLTRVKSALSHFALDGRHVSASVVASAPVAPYAPPMQRKVEIRLSAWAPEIG